MAFVKNFLNKASGSSGPQDNKFQVAYYRITTADIDNINTTILSSVFNAGPLVTVDEFHLLVIQYIITIPPIIPGDPYTYYTYKYVLDDLGKGTYGSGGTSISGSDLILIYSSSVLSQDILDDPTTQIFGDPIRYDITGTTVSDYVNTNPDILIQNQIDGYVVFKTIDGVEEKDYLFLAPGGTYGITGLQTIELDFQLLNNTAGGLQSLQDVINVNKVADRVEFSKLMFLGQTFSTAASFPPGFPNPYINSLVPSASGGYYLYGNFGKYGDSLSQDIVKINDFGLIDYSFNSKTNVSNVGFGGGYPFSGVSLVENLDGTLYVSGYFTSYNTVSRKGIVKINPDGSINSWTTGVGVAGSSQYCTSLVVQEIGVNADKVIIIGEFTSFNGAAKQRITRINTDGTPDTSYGAGGVGFAGGATTATNMVKVSNDNVIITGYFASYNGTACANIVKLDEDGIRDGAFAANTGAQGFNTGVTGGSATQLLKTLNGEILCAGYFTAYNGTPANRIIRLFEDGSIDTNFDYGIGFNGPVNYLNLCYGDTKYLVQGDFTSYKGVASSGIIILNEDGSIYETFTGINGTYQWYQDRLIGIPDSGPNIRKLVQLVDGVEYSTVKQALTFNEVTGKAEYNPLMFYQLTDNELVPKKFIQQMIDNSGASQNLQHVTDTGNVTDNPMRVQVANEYTEIDDQGVLFRNGLINSVHRIANQLGSADATFLTPNKSGPHILATTEDTVTEVIGGTNVSVNSSDPTKPIISAIPSTSAGVFDRVYFTGEVEAGMAGVNPVYKTLRNGKGSVASVTLTATGLTTSTKVYIPNDLIGPSQIVAGTLPIGNYTSFLSVLPSSAVGVKRFTIEIFKTDAGGTIINGAGPISGDATGIYAGKNTVTVLDSGYITLAAANDVIGLTGYLAAPLSVAIGQRFRYHISVARGAGAGGSQTMNVNIGNNWNSYVEAPVPITTSTVINVSTKTGATQTDVNNILVEGAASSTTDYVPQWSDTSGKLLKAGKRVQTSQTDNTAGSLMNVGAFGLGSTATAMPPLVSDCNNILYNGFYYCNATTTNTPIDLNTFSLIHFRNTNSLGASQIAMELANGKMFFRSSDVAGTWSEWVEAGKRYYNNYTSASVSGNFNLDFTKLVQNITLTGATVFVNFNLPTPPKTIVLELIVNGNFALTLPSNWVGLPNNDTYSTTVKNHFIVSCTNFGVGNTEVLYSLTNMLT